MSEPSSTDRKVSSTPLKVGADGEIEGWMMKKGDKGLVKGWRRRFFSSRAGHLRYYMSEGEAEEAALGSIPLFCCSGVDEVEVSGKARGLNIETPGRTYVLGSDEEQHVAGWHAGLRAYVARTREKREERLARLEAAREAQAARIEELEALLKEREDYVNDLSKQTDLISLITNNEVQVQQKVMVLMREIKERDEAIKALKKASSSTLAVPNGGALGSPSASRKSKQCSGEGLVAALCVSPTSDSNLPSLREPSRSGSREGSGRKVRAQSLSVAPNSGVLLTPPPWQILKLMESVPGGKESIPGLKSHSDVAELPTSKPKVVLRKSSDSEVEKVRRRSALFSASESSVGIPLMTSDQEQHGDGSLAAPGEVATVAGEEDEPLMDVSIPKQLEVTGDITHLALDDRSSAETSLHPMGLPTQGLLRLPRKSPKTAKLNAVDGEDIPFTHSFEDLAQRASVVFTKQTLPISKPSKPRHASKKRASLSGGSPSPDTDWRRRRSTLSGEDHNTRFQEELLSQLRADQFELMKQLKEMQDDAEVHQMQMNQLQERLENAQEIIQEKTAEVETQSLMLEKLRSSISKANSTSPKSARKRLSFNPPSSTVKAESKGSPRQFGMDGSGSDDSPISQSPVLGTALDVSDELAREVTYRQALEKQIDRLNLRLEALEDVKEAQRLEMQSEYEERVQDLLSALSGRDESIAKLEARLSQEQSRVLSLREQLGRLSPTGRGTHSQQLARDEFERAQEQITQLAGELRGKEAEQLRENEERVVLAAQLKAVRRAYQGLQADLRKKDALIREQQQQAQQASGATAPSSDMRKLRDRLQAETERAFDLRVELDEQEHKLEALREYTRETLVRKDAQLAAVSRRYDKLRLLLVQDPGQAEQEAEALVREEMSELREKYFYALALSIKLNISKQGKICNIDVGSLFLSAKHLPWKGWEEWLGEQIDEQQLASKKK